MADDEALVTGEIVFGEDARPFAGATAYVRLEDVGRADASSLTVAEQAIPDVAFEPGRQAAPAFSLRGRLPDQRGSYAVRVHVDLDGDGQVSPGDYLSMESYPVLTYGYPNHVSVRVRPVS